MFVEFSATQQFIYNLVFITNVHKLFPKHCYVLQQQQRVDSTFNVTMDNTQAMQIFQAT